MQPADKGAGGRQAEQAALASEQEGAGRMARVVGAAVGGKVHGGCRAEVDLEALLLENRLGVRPFAVAAGLVARGRMPSDRSICWHSAASLAASSSRGRLPG